MTGGGRRGPWRAKGLLLCRSGWVDRQAKGADGAGRPDDGMVGMVAAGEMGEGRESNVSAAGRLKVARFAGLGPRVGRWQCQSGPGRPRRRSVALSLGAPRRRAANRTKRRGRAPRVGKQDKEAAAAAAAILIDCLEPCGVRRVVVVVVVVVKDRFRSCKGTRGYFGDSNSTDSRPPSSNGPRRGLLASFALCSPLYPTVALPLWSLGPGFSAGGACPGCPCARCRGPGSKLRGDHPLSHTLLACLEGLAGGTAWKEAGTNQLTSHPN